MEDPLIGALVSHWQTTSEYPAIVTIENHGRLPVRLFYASTILLMFHLAGRKTQVLAVTRLTWLHAYGVTETI